MAIISKSKQTGKILKFASSSPDSYGKLGVECSGRTFGSWITGRNGLASGDLISQVPYAIESILRDELGVPGSRIDTASFDAAFANALTIKLNLTSDFEIESTDLLQKLAFQGGLVYVVSCGRHRLVDIQDLTPTSVATIPFADMVNYPQVSKTNINDVVNRLKVYYDFAPEYSAYKRVDTFNNSTSQSLYGRTNEAEIFLPHITKESALILRTVLVPDSGVGLWTHTKLLVSWDTVGWKWAHLEIGDFVELDAASVDPHLKPFGSSWSNVKILIQGIERGPESVSFNGVQL